MEVVYETPKFEVTDLLRDAGYERMWTEVVEEPLDHMSPSRRESTRQRFGHIENLYSVRAAAETRPGYSSPSKTSRIIGGDMNDAVAAAHSMAEELRCATAAP